MSHLRGGNLDLPVRSYEPNVNYKHFVYLCKRLCRWSIVSTVFVVGKRDMLSFVSRYPRRIPLCTASSQFVQHEIGQQKMPQVIYSKPLWLMWKATWAGLAEAKQSEQSERECSSGTLVEIVKGLEILGFWSMWRTEHYMVDSIKGTCLAVGSVFVCNVGIQTIWSITVLLL